MSSAQETWNSLYTDKLETIWKCNPPELQKPAMIYYVLQQELQRVQDNLSLQMKEFTSNVEHQISSIEELELQQRQRESVTAPLSENELSRSPTLNKTRNICFKRRTPNLRLNLTKENLMRTEDLDVEIIESSPEPIFNRTKLKDAKKLFTHKTPSKNRDIVDSSLVRPTTSGFSFPKKTNKKISKRSPKNDKSTTTLTQIFRMTPTSKSTKSSDQISPKFEKIEKILEDDSDDETFCEVEMDTSTVITKEVKTTFKDYDKSTKSSDQISSKFEKLEKILKDVSNDETFCEVKMDTSPVIKKEVKIAFKDYDKFPIARPKSPLYAHKRGPVRRKAERMQLPGWSCDDCRNFYESSNLSPEALREKMNVCSRHRGKFNPNDETVDGYWDIAMFSTQDIL